jgi:hypothetical protein
VLYFISIRKIPILILTMVVTTFISLHIFIENNLHCKDLKTNIDYFMYGAFPAYSLIMFRKKITILINMPPYPLNSILNKYVDYIEPILFGLLFSSAIYIYLPKKLIKNQFKIYIFYT